MEGDDAPSDCPAQSMEQLLLSPLSHKRQPKRQRRAFCARKRIGLRIEAKDEEAEEKEHHDDEKQEKQATSTDDSVPWWVLEYRCPPPGHLGAHNVPVAASECENEAKHETPERASRRATADALAAPVCHSSPNQKRKIRHLHDRDPSSSLPIQVTKELKRFHESTESASASKTTIANDTTPSSSSSEVASSLAVSVMKPTTNAANASSSA